MSLSLSSFSRPAAIPITLPNKEIVEASPLSVRAERLLERAHPRPRPPMVAQAGKGSLAAKVPDREDPEYIEAFGVWYDQHELLKLAAAMDYQPEDGQCWVSLASSGEVDNATVCRWCTSVIEDLENILSPRWIEAASKKLGDQDLGELVDQAGRGNSGTPLDQ